MCPTLFYLETGTYLGAPNMGYIPYVLNDMIAWRIKYVEDVKNVIDSLLRMLDHGVSKRTVCYMLAGIHYRLDALKADIAKLGTDLAWYVGSRTVSRLNQVEVSKDVITKLYEKNMIAYQVYQRGITILGIESYAIYSRWTRFKEDLEQAYTNLNQKIDEVLAYLESKMDEVCKE